MNIETERAKTLLGLASCCLVFARTAKDLQAKIVECQSGYDDMLAAQADAVTVDDINGSVP